MTRKVDRLLDLLILVGYSVAFPVTLAKRLSGHEQYDRCVMYRAIREGHGHLWTQAVGNVGAFVPMGMLLGFLGRGKWWKVLLISVGFSVLIETLQFVSLRGFAEFDDVFHNVVGAMIGYGVYVGVRWVVRKLVSFNPN